MEAIKNLHFHKEKFSEAKILSYREKPDCRVADTTEMNDCQIAFGEVDMKSFFQ